MFNLKIAEYSNTFCSKIDGTPWMRVRNSILSANGPEINLVASGFPAARMVFSDGPTYMKLRFSGMEVKFNNHENKFHFAVYLPIGSPVAGTIAVASFHNNTVMATAAPLY